MLAHSVKAHSASGSQACCQAAGMALTPVRIANRQPDQRLMRSLKRRGKRDWHLPSL
ncbi:MAG: hypothetical protein H0T53_13205 [Herpetosiphonaceae bacterium]|nr:hypothetical protein [Herpetosiphonaceae bacterium]